MVWLLLLPSLKAVADTWTHHDSYEQACEATIVPFLYGIAFLHQFQKESPDRIHFVASKELKWQACHGIG